MVRDSTNLSSFINYNSTQIDQIELGLPRELLINANGNRILANYYNFMVESAKLFGANVTKATPELLDILRFEMKLAKVQCECEFVCDFVLKYFLIFSHRFR